MKRKVEKLTAEQAKAIQTRFRETKGYKNLCQAFPTVKKAVDSLPDESGFEKCNVFVRDIFDNAKADVQGLKRKT
jgi:hypothetical protein